MIPRDKLVDSILTSDKKLKHVVKSLNESKIKLVLCIDETSELIGTLTDGDVRRGLLNGMGMQTSILEIVNKNPVLSGPSTTRENIDELMDRHSIDLVPVVSSEKQLLGLHVKDKMSLLSTNSNLTMIIMAGGKGVRLRPLTDDCPKPMLEISGKPMLQHIIERAKEQGFSKFIILVNYLAEMITDFFGNGRNLGVDIEYIFEQEPLGTAGALSLIKNLPDDVFVVTNGDVITDLNYFDLIEFCKSKSAIGAMAIKSHEMVNPFGVVELDGMFVSSFKEKPSYISYINAGVYALSPKAIDYLEFNLVCDMPTLLERIRSSGHPILGYPMHEPWLDVGRHKDLDSIKKIYGELK
jgi:dTDP-glucose pyrophosphorylase